MRSQSFCARKTSISRHRRAKCAPAIKRTKIKKPKAAAFRQLIKGRAPGLPLTRKNQENQEVTRNPGKKHRTRKMLTKTYGIPIIIY